MAAHSHAEKFIPTSTQYKQKIFTCL